MYNKVQRIQILDHSQSRLVFTSNKRCTLVTRKLSELATIWLILLIMGCWTELRALDACYHTPDEIIAELRDLQETFPEWVRIDSIGHGARLGRPIWMARLSDNPDELEAEPALLFVGQVHAEEVVGIEIVFRLMHNLLDSLHIEAPRARLENLDLYFIPTLNPEGLEVVHSGQDVTFRKNCRDNIGDGVFRFRNGWGWDTSGVDLNRNFGLHWENGDTLFQRGGLDGVYNYYRGAAPFSEPEAQALRDLALERRFLYSVVYHSSRSGVNAESIIAPWYWEGKRPPDGDAIDEILNEIAFMTPTFDGENSYAPIHARQRNGQTQDWFYQTAGCIQYMIEVGHQIQPDSTAVTTIVDDNIPAATFLMDLAYGAASLADYGTLTVLAQNSQTGQPVAAEVSINGISQPLLEPRNCADNGRLDWFLPEGEHSVTVSADGYLPQVFDATEIASRGRTIIEVRLQPLDRMQVVFQAVDMKTDESLPARICLENDFGRRVFTCQAGFGANLMMSAGVYRATVTMDGYLPMISDLAFAEGRVIEFCLNPAEVVFDEEFESLRDWGRGGVGQNWAVVTAEGRSALTESPGGMYVPHSTAWLDLPVDFQNQPQNGAVLQIIHKPNFEPGYDYGEVVAWDEGMRAWVDLASFSQFPEDWDTTYIDLDRLSAGEMLFRMQITADGSVEEDGWLIDRLTVIAGKYEQSVSADEPLPAAFDFNAYPNPFNDRLNVSFTLPDPRQAGLFLYNAAGQRVFETAERWYPAGVNHLSLDAAGLPSGTYFLNYQDDRMTRVTSVRLVK